MNSIEPFSILDDNASESIHGLSDEDTDIVTLPKKKEPFAKRGKASTIASIKQLQIHVKQMEKEKRSIFYKKSEHYKELENIDTNNNQQLKKDYKNLATNIEKISQKVKKFKREKENMGNSNSHFCLLKELMEEIELHIMEFKEKQKVLYEEILVAESQLRNDIDKYQVKFEDWSNIKTPFHKEKINSISKEKNEIHAPPEVYEFEEFLDKTGGYRGGWDEIDHNLFLKLRRKHKVDEKLLKEAVNEIPTQTSDDIQQHIIWYKEFRILQENKRNAIRQWKSSKEHEKQELLNHANDMLQKNRNKETRMREIYEKERETRLQQLEEWKKSKAKEELEKQKLSLEMKEKKRLKQITEERKNHELKLKVEEYKIQKQLEDAVIKEAMKAREIEERKTLNDVELSRIRERNDKIFAAKQEQLLLKESERQAREMRTQQLKQKFAVDVPRDPSRLYKLTEGCKLRNEEKKKAERLSNPYNSNIRMLPHRSVPAWREGLH